MKTKKLLSSITALAVTASAFVSFAVTANAEAVEKSFIGSSVAAETFDNFSAENWSSTAGTFTASATDNNHFGIISVTEVQKPEIGEAVTTGTLPTYVSGNALDTQVRGKTAATTTYMLPSVVDNGILYFETDVFSHATYVQQGPRFCFYDSQDNLIAYAEVDYADNAYIRVYNADSTQLDRTESSMNFRKNNNPGIGYHVGMTFDIDNNTITFNADIISNSGIRTAGTQKSGDPQSCSINDIAKFTIEFSGNASSNNFGVAIDNMKLYAMVNPSQAGALIVDYVDPDGNSISDSTNIDVSGKNSGDIVSYSYPKYIVNNNTLYLSEATEYTKSATLTDSDQHIKVTYNPQGTGTYQYMDWDGSTNDVSSPSNGGFTTENTSFVVEEDGIYTIEGMAYSDGAGDRYIELVLNDLPIFRLGGATRFGTSFTVTEVELKANDVVNVNRRDSHGGYIDYILLTKTGDIPTFTPAEVSEVTQEVAPWTAGDGTWANAFKFTVTPNDDVITGVKVTAKGATADKTFSSDTTLSGESGVIFGVIASTTSATDAETAAQILPTSEDFSVELSK